MESSRPAHVGPVGNGMMTMTHLWIFLTASMWSPETRNAALTLAGTTLVTLVAVQVANRLVQWRVAQHYRYAQAHRRKDVPRKTLRDFVALQHRWVALCGTVFNVSDDPFFDVRAGGIYARWVGHDVAALLVYGGVIDGRPKHETEAELMDMEIKLRDVDSTNGDLAQRRRSILEEWYARFHMRYEVVGQFSDLYDSEKWETLRDQITPRSLDEDDGHPRRRGKCPLGFGSSAVEEEEVQIREEDVGLLREIHFQGRRYDVRGSALFDGLFASFVGHDITYALAIQSNDPQDLDVVPSSQYTYDEQIRLEQYRRLFAKELRVISASDVAEPPTSQQETVVVDLHQLIDQEADVYDIRRALDQIIGSADDILNAVCPRTTLTPLHKAVEKNQLELVKLLVHAGADANAPAALYDDETALQMAQRFKFTEIATVLSAHVAQ